MSRLEDLFRLDNRVAVVSGGAGLIGSRLCAILADAGAEVAIIDVDHERADIESRTISEKTSRRVEFFEADITEERSVNDVVAEIYDVFGKADILINAAHFKGGTFFKDIGDYSLDTWNQVAAVNLTGSFLLCREIGQRMFQGNGGVIVNISSTYGVVSADPRIYGGSGINSPISYATTKAGIINMTKYLAVHWAPRVRANVLVPGGVAAGQDPEFVRNYEYRTPLQRMAEAEEYQGAILFMCSDASSYMTGSVVTVDGGWTAW